MRPCCPFCGEDFHLFITHDDQGNEIAECQIGNCPGRKGFRMIDWRIRAEAAEIECSRLREQLLKEVQYVDAAKKEALPQEVWTGRPLPEIVKAMKERCDEAWRINESICCHCGKQFAVDDLAVFTASGFVCAKCDVGRMYTALKTAASDGGIVEKEVIRRMVHDMAEPGEAMIPISPDLEQIDQEHRLWPEMDVDVPEE